MSQGSTCGRWLKAIAIALVLGAPFSVGEVAADAAESKKIFTQRCMACHSFGKGVKVGPDLRGVTERRPRAWLVKFIRSSQSMISAGDPVAVELFQQFKQQQMPDWLDLTDEQIGDLLDWLAASGPDQREGDTRPAPSASAQEIESGRQLFHGEKALSLGGTACGSCHSVDDEGARPGGALGPDLTAAYALYQEGALTQAIKRPCTLRLPEDVAGRPAGFLSADEVFALKAYLYDVGDARGRRDEGEPGAAAPGAAPPQGASPAAGASPPAGAAGTTKPARWAPQAREGGPMVRTTAAGGELLFGALPYAALALFFVGMGARYAGGKRRLGALGEEAREAWRLYGGAGRAAHAWRAGVAVTAIAHLVGLAMPRLVAEWAAAPWRLYLLEGTGLVFGALMLAGLVPLLLRVLTKDAGHGKRWRELADCLFLSGLFAAVLSGLAIALAYRWGALWSAGTMTPYLQSLLRGAPAPGFVEQMPLLVRVHVMAWLLLVALAPATSAAAIALCGLDRALALLASPLSAVGRAADRARARLSPAGWLWPEEDRVQPLAAAELAEPDPSNSSPRTP